MNHQSKDFSDCRVLGFAIKQAGEILEPFITNDEALTAFIGSIQTFDAMKQHYPLAPYLKLLKIAEQSGLLERLGKAAAIHGVQPLLRRDDITTVADILRVIEKEIPRQYQGNVGRFSVTMLDEACAELFDATFAPCGFLASFVERTMAGFGTKEIDINHQPNNCRKHGAEACKYTFTWSGSELLALTRQK